MSMPIFVRDYDQACDCCRYVSTGCIRLVHHSFFVPLLHDVHHSNAWYDEGSVHAQTTYAGPP